MKIILLGITVSSHDTRSLEENRKIARRMLQERLDMHYNKDLSYIAINKKKKATERENKRKKSIENLKKKLAFKQLEI